MSIPPPSNYPNFSKLASQVAKDSLLPEENEPIDRFLGRLHSSGVKVHELVHQQLSNPKSNPNSLHYDLLRLLHSKGPLRLVTTNFDLHFTTAAQSQSSQSNNFETFSAPALPLGFSFNGIVYLHGSVDKPADRLVLTDSDFGRAYLTEGWARRFLQQLFTEFVVLFVGYSHRDPIMNYLARGLPPMSEGKERYALTLEEDSNDWKWRGVIPIIYPPGDKEDKHVLLGTALASWADRIEMGALQREKQLKEIVELPVSLNIEHLDIVRDALRDASGTRFFTRHCKNAEWMRWIECEGLFKSLFSPGSVVSEKEVELAAWFADRFVSEHTGDALAVVQRQGSQLHEALWVTIAHHLFRTKPKPEILGRWVPVLIESSPRNRTRDLLDYLLTNLTSPEGDAIALLLFEYLTRPDIELKKDFWRGNKESENEDVSVEIGTQGSQYWLDEAWNRIFRNRLDHFGDKLIWIISSHLERAHFLLKSSGKIYEQWDQLSSHRNTIEHSGGIREGIDILVDAGVQLLESYVSIKQQRLDFLIEWWFCSECRLLKRLAIYGVAKNTHWIPKNKISWLLNNNLLFASGLKHEVFLVLENAYGQSPVESREAVLIAALKMTGIDAESDNKSYQTYNLLVWLDKVAPNCPVTKQYLERVKAANPEFGPREHPDLDVVIKSGTFEPEESPIRAEDLLAKNPKELLDFILSFQEKSIYGPNRSGLLRELESAVKQSFSWSNELVEQLRAHGVAESDLWSPILRGWNSGQLSASDWEIILHLLRDNSEILEHAQYDVANFLEEGIKKSSNPIPDVSLDLAFTVSEKLWITLSKFPYDKYGDIEDWFQFAINRPEGILTHFWLNLISRWRKQMAEQWTGLPLGMKKLFSSILPNDFNKSCATVRVVLASQLNFLFWSDQEWTTSNILPLLDSEAGAERAKQCWQGYLISAGWSEPIFPTLLTLTEKQFSVLGSQPERVRERFCEYLASVACFGPINPAQNGWLGRFMKWAPENLRDKWASYVDMMLRQMEDPIKEKTWNLWLMEYWQERLNGVPLPLTPGEAGEMTEWCLHLEPVFPLVVDKIIKSPPPELKYAMLYYELPETGIPEKHPKATAELILFLLKESNAPIYDFDRIDQVFKTLIQARMGRNILFQICDELARVGHAGASKLKELIPEDYGPSDEPST